MHAIDDSNNRDNMAYVGETPWHGLGQKLTADADIDTWKIEAGLNWHIEKRPIAYGVRDADGNITPQPIEGQFAHVRDDTQAFLGQGSDQFKLLQPGDALEFFRDLVADSRFSLETAGSLWGGKQLWALARANVKLTIDGVDEIRPYLLLATKNDGSMATVADFTGVRVVCNNTLSFAVGTNGRDMKVRVPHSRKFNHAEVKRELGLIDDRLEKFALDADRLAQTKVDREQAVEFFVSLYAKYDDDGKITNERTLNGVMPKLLNAYARGPGANLPTARGTAWGLVNAITNYADFDSRAQSRDNRFASGQLGANLKLKQDAFDKALALAA